MSQQHLPASACCGKKPGTGRVAIAGNNGAVIALAGDSSTAGVASLDVILVGRAVRCGLLEAKLRLLKEPAHRNSKTNKTAPAINIFFTSGITDKFERNMDRFNNKRDIAHEKKFNMNVSSTTTFDPISLTSS
ncbi:MAG: hypothetical protein ACTHMB_21010 [Candidatus Binatia bacterium]